MIKLIYNKFGDSMNNNMEERLANIAANLKPGEVRTLTIDRTKMGTSGSERLICKIHNDVPTSDKSVNNVILMPFTATREDDTKVIIRGKMDTPTIKKAKEKNSGFKLFRNFVTNKLKEYSQREDDYDKVYYDEYDRPYEIIDGIKTYYDDRGMPYYLKYDMNGNEYAWIKLTDGSEGVFLNSDKTIILVHGKAYRFDGDIHYDEEINYIGPHR